MRPDRPLLVVKIELRVDADEVHVGLEVGIDRADIPPVGITLSIFVAKRKGMHSVGMDYGR